MLRRFARSVARPYTTSSLWFSRTLGGSDSTNDDPDNGMSVRYFLSDKRQLIEWIHAYKNRFPFIYSAAELELAQSQPHVFVGLMDGPSIIGLITVGVRLVYIKDFGQVVRFPSRDSFICNTFVLPEYRGKSIAYRGVKKTIGYLRHRGFARLWCHIEAWNRPSLYVYRRAGFEHVGDVRFLRTCGLRFFLRDGRHPFLRLETFLRRSTIPLSSESTAQRLAEPKAPFHEQDNL